MLGMILTKLYQEKVEIINFICSQGNDLDIKLLFEDDLELIDAKMEFILDYKEDITETIVPETNTKNRIVFLKNSSNEPFIFRSLKGYEEYYESFLELLNSIVEGSFKNFRILTNNNEKITDVMEVKGFKTRILFNRVKGDIYIILGAFVKKCDTDLRHRNYIINASQNYQNQKDFILKAIENEEYMNQEEMYLQNLIAKLNERGKVKKYETN